MEYEIFDAVLETYKHDKETIRDCCMYFVKHIPNDKLKYLSEDWLEENGYCCDCGEKLIEVRYEEPHDELLGCPIEVFYDLICKNCD